MIFTFDMLKKAYHKTKSVNAQKSNRVKYRDNLEQNLSSLLPHLNSADYKPSKLRIKVINVPKRREVQVPSINDKIVQHAICDYYAYSKLVEPLITETSACIIGRGDVYGSRKLKEQLHDYYKKNKSEHFYALKCDIHHFFASEPINRTRTLIEKYIEDCTVQKLMINFLSIQKQGLPLGLQQSQLLSNLQLSDMDHMLKEKYGCKYYGRYQDDFYIISKDKKFLESMWKIIDKYVQSIGLTLNPKTEITEDRLTYLGFTYKLTPTGKVIQSYARSKKRAKHKQLKKMLAQLAKGEITPEKLAFSYESWRQHVLKGQCGALVAQKDKWLKDKLDKLGFEFAIEKTKKTKKLRKVKIYVKTSK